MKAEIFVKFSEVAMHCWPGAPDRRAYLRAEHRHLFFVEVRTEVRHGDREIEFHDLLDEAKMLFGRAIADLPISRSCEMIAHAIAAPLRDRYRRSFAVTVSEDNECGATLIEV